MNERITPELREMIFNVIDQAPCDCGERRRDFGQHLSSCYLFDLNLAIRSPQPADIEKVLTEHSGCGSGTQVDQISVRLNPGDKVVLRMGRISAAIARALPQVGEKQ